MISRILTFSSEMHDAFQKIWTSSSGRHFQGNILILCFIVSIAMIEAGMRGWLPQNIVFHLPANHMGAINIVFTVLLMFEGIGLALAFVASVSESVAKQFEIFSLILIRDAFKEMTGLDEPVSWDKAVEVVPVMAVLGLSALVIFVALGFYNGMLKKNYAIRDDESRRLFIRSKELISMILLVSFIIICVTDMWEYFGTGKNETIFHSFFTLLAFTDVLMVLVSLKYGNMYALAFRDSAFAVATVMMRLAMMAPPVYGALIGSGSSLFVIGIVAAYNRYASVFLNTEKLKYKKLES